MRMRNTSRVLPGMNDVIDHVTNAFIMLRLGEDNRTVPSHSFCIAFHYAQVCANSRCEVGLVDHKKIGLRETGTTFSGDFITSGNIDHLDRKISQLTAEAGGQIIAAGFEQKNLGFELAMQFLQRQEIC